MGSKKEIVMELKREIVIGDSKCLMREIMKWLKREIAVKLLEIVIKMKILALVYSLHILLGDTIIPADVDKANEQLTLFYHLYCKEICTANMHILNHFAFKF